MDRASPPRDHPRVCGEHQGFLDLLNEGRGSSPRMRGTLYEVAADFLRSGIIPAYAGNTLPTAGVSSVLWDHPRVCGEHSVWPYTPAIPAGSSPRMRGTLHMQIMVDRVDGIIPAYAGNTRCETPCTALRRDHPRVCGEHIQNTWNAFYQAGSSPRMRGTRMPRRWTPCTQGIIPAYAGNTYPLTHCIGLIGDHPRVCGEHELSMPR